MDKTEFTELRNKFVENRGELAHLKAIQQKEQTEFTTINNAYQRDVDSVLTSNYDQASIGQVFESGKPVAIKAKQLEDRKRKISQLKSECDAIKWRLKTPDWVPQTQETKTS